MYTYPSLRDGGSVWNMYKMNNYIPLNYVIGPDGIVVSSMEGFNEYTIRSWIESVLPQGVSEENRVRIADVTASPNPATGPVAIRFSLPRAEHARVLVYSSAGTLVRTLDAGLANGITTVNWDLADEAGHSVGSGLYFGQLVTGTEVSQFKFSVLR